MAFTSLPFLVLVAVAVIGYYWLPKWVQWGRVQWIWLLFVSYVFYGAGNGSATVWLLLVSGATWLAGICLGELERRHTVRYANAPVDERKAHRSILKRQKKRVCAGYLLAVFGLLYVMKYWNFTTHVLHADFLPRWDFLLPLGLSFFIFQSAGYVIDVYRDSVPPERNPLKVALFTSFFPQMIQGPISRFPSVAPSLYAVRRWNAQAAQSVQYGLQLALGGYLKKMVVADRAAVIVNTVFASPDRYGGAVLAGAVFFYCIQLYCDFSGGIDITRGVAQLFGIALSDNFCRPFFATSLTDYWRRWHITLGAWMRDYLFYPLSLSKPFARLGKWGRKHLPGKAGKILATSLATFIVYFVIGIWHGANFRYIAFGLWNGILITASLLLESTFLAVRRKLRISDDSVALRVFRIARTCLLVFIGRYLTRAPRLLVALSMLQRTVTDVQWHQLTDGTFLSLGLPLMDIGIVLLGMAVILGVEAFQERGGQVRDSLARQSAGIQWLAMVVPLTVLLLFGIMREGYIASEFIYKQF